MVKTNKKSSHVGFQNQTVDEKDKTLPQWKALPKEVQLKCQARNLVVTGFVATLAKRLYDSYHLNAAVMAPGAEETDAQPEAVPPQAQPQPLAQHASGPSHPPSQAGPFQASSTSSTNLPSVSQPATVDQWECLRSLLREELSRLAPSLMAFSNQVSALATMPPQQFQPEVPVNYAVGPQGTYPQPNFSMALQRWSIFHSPVCKVATVTSIHHPVATNYQLPHGPLGCPQVCFQLLIHLLLLLLSLSLILPLSSTLTSQVSHNCQYHNLDGSMYEKIKGREFIELCDLLLDNLYGSDASQISYEIQVDSDSRG